MKIFPFRGWHPTKEKAPQIISLPYDVVSRQEAKRIIADNDKSFMKVIRPDGCFPDDVSPYDDKIYNKASENIQSYKQNKEYIRDETPNFYLYKQIMGAHEQLGLVATCHIDDYINDKILKHELTREEKQEDRTRHITVTNHNTGPVFLFYKEKSGLNVFMEDYINKHDAFFDIQTEDGIYHKFWIVHESEAIKEIQNYAESFSRFYIADGHHRAASSASAGERIRNSANNPSTDDHEHFLSIIFPAEQLKILDYNRVIKDLNQYSPDELLMKIKEHFNMSTLDISNPEDAKPKQRHSFAMYLENKWYHLSPKEDIDDSDVLASLDVNILYNKILNPLLNIGNPRTDKRIDFIGGIRGLSELKKLVDNNQYQIAFALYPTSIQELINVSDSGLTMPPKSTWFEPKLRSGMVLHQLTD